MKISTRFALILLSSAAFAWSAQAAAPMLHDGTFVGGTYDAYYGLVQVQATVQGGSIVDVRAIKFPDHRRTSREINAQALPYLLQEVVSKQNSHVDIISGATLTSEAYIRSLHDALLLAIK